MQSLYSSDVIITHIDDPVYNRSNQRSIFQLPNDKNILTNMRLGNIGVYATVASTYNGLIGALGCIDSIQLMDAQNTVLDELQNFPAYMGFKQYNSDPQTQHDSNPILHKNSMGMFYGGEMAADGTGQKIQKYEINDAARAVATTEAATATAWLLVSDVLPLLKTVLSINTQVLRDLRLIINYTQDNANYIIESGNGPFNTCQPLLIYDENTGPLKPFVPMAYKSIEHDKIYVDAVLANGTQMTNPQSVQHTINGFNNKKVGKMLIVKTPTLLSTYQDMAGVNMRYGKLGSIACFKEALQVDLNGHCLFNGDGITSDNERLALLTDNFGPCSTYPFANGSAYVELDANNRNSLIDIGNNVLSNLDYYGFLIQSEVSDLKINFRRVGVYVQNAANVDITTTASANQALELNLFAEVFKSVTSDNRGGYLVNYV